MNLIKAISVIKTTPEMEKYCNRWGGSLLYDTNSDAIFFCNEDDKTYYEKWNYERNAFDFWGSCACSELKPYNLYIAYNNEDGYEE